MKIIFAGTPPFAASALEALHREHQVVAVLTQPDRPAGRGMQLSLSAVKQISQKFGLSVRQPASLKNTNFQEEIAALCSDVMIVAAYGLILPKAVLELPRYGCLNIHASLLPRWRGAAPIQRAIQAGDLETGITIMQMDEGLDTGDILLQQTCAIAPEDTAQTLHDKLALIGADSVLESLRMLEAKHLQPIRQDNNAASYAPKLQKSEARIDWRKDANVIERTVRAFNPYPVCQSDFNGVTLKIWQSSLNLNQHGEPGRILEVDKKGIVVACGVSAIRLEVLQRPGGKAQPVAQLLQAMPVRVGDHFALC